MRDTIRGMSLALGVTVAVTGALLAGPAAATQVATSKLKSCGMVTGAKWVFPQSGGRLKGNTYGVTAVNFDCAAAKKWAVQLSGTKLSGSKRGTSYPFKGGPTGYACTANPDAKGKLLAASCVKGKGPTTKGFSFGGVPAGAPTG